MTIKVPEVTSLVYGRYGVGSDVTRVQARVGSAHTDTATQLYMYMNLTRPPALNFDDLFLTPMSPMLPELIFFETSALPEPALDLTTPPPLNLVENCPLPEPALTLITTPHPA